MGGKKEMHRKKIRSLTHIHFKLETYRQEENDIFLIFRWFKYNFKYFQ